MNAIWLLPPAAVTCSPLTLSNTAFQKSRRGELNPGPADYESAKYTIS